MPKVILLLSILPALFSLLPLTACSRSESSPDEQHKNAQIGIIVALGDSLTEGLGVKPDEAYPALLQRTLHGGGYPYKVINAGISGETSSGALSRINSILSFKPDIVIVETGANDAFRGNSLATIERNINEILWTLKARNVTVVLAGMQTLSSFGREYNAGLQDLYLRVAQNQDVVLIPFFLAGVAGIKRLNQFDGIHPNAEGYKIIADTIYPYVLEAIRKRKGDPTQ